MSQGTEKKKCCGKSKELNRVDGKVAVVTGANTGIGYITAKTLNLHGAKVYLLCRNYEKTQAAIDQLVQEGCEGSRLIFEKCDLASFASIRNCAENLLKQEDVIDILVNNAGIMHYPKFELTIDGNEMTWQSNHLGPFLLTELLLPAIKRSQSARIVLVSSLLHKMYRKKINFNEVNTEGAFGNWEPYNRSKLANVMHARALTHRLQQENVHNVTVNSLHPGVVKTDLYRTQSLSSKITGLFFAPAKLFFKTPEQGAQTSIYLALSPNVEGVTGKYFSDSAVADESCYALDDQACEELYLYSRQAVGLKN